MKWHDPKIDKLPEHGDIVWVLLVHIKRNGIKSCEIKAGEVSVDEDGNITVHNGDDIGEGWVIWNLYSSDYTDAYAYREDIVAWAPSNEIEIPEYALKRD